MLRRDLLVGGACGLAAAAAYVLKPHRRVSLMGGRTLAQITPAEFGGWSSLDVSDLVAPSDEQSLSAKLYDEIVEKVFRHPDTGAQVMVLLAHGAAQTNDLQVHRPEECYPAFGFSLSQAAEKRLPLGAALSLPARQLVADAPGRREIIVYWVRMGDRLPASAREQRLDRLAQAMEGVVPDGLLARFSVVGTDTTAALTTLEQFIPQFLAAVRAEHRRAFVGPRVAGAMAS